MVYCILHGDGIFWMLVQLWEPPRKKKKEFTPAYLHQVSGWTFVLSGLVWGKEGERSLVEQVQNPHQTLVPRIYLSSLRTLGQPRKILEGAKQVLVVAVL